MARRHYVNNAPQQLISAQINNVATTLTVPSFASWPTQFPFYATLELGTVAEEIVLVTNIVAQTATITRAQDGSAAITHLAGATFDFTVVSADYDEANAHVNGTAGVHGVSGSVVGTSDVQTLSNKTLSAPVITGAGSVATGALTATGPANLNGGATVQGTLGVSGTMAVTGNETVSGTSTITGNVTAANYPLGPWNTYTPTLTQNGAAVAKTVNYAKYIQIGKTVFGNVTIAATAAGTLNTNINSSLPVTPVTASLVIGSFWYLTAGNVRYEGVALYTGGLVYFQHAGATNWFGVNPSFAIASGDSFYFNFQYEVA
jgi:hypothetical protein